MAVQNSLAFQLTTSHGGRPFCVIPMTDRLYLSTHDLTRRSTKTLHQPRIWQGLSTHDLTRRSTPNIQIGNGIAELFQLTTSHGGRHISDKAFARRASFNSRPHTEVDGIRGCMGKDSEPFNSRPHTEVDCLHASRSCAVSLTFNSRPHTEVDSFMHSIRIIDSIFQLTTSHGGRRASRGYSINRLELSTHDLTRRSTKVMLRIPAQNTSFNSRPHTEVDVVPPAGSPFCSLSTHDLTRRSTVGRVVLFRQLDLSTHDLTRRSTTLRLYRRII